MRKETYKKISEYINSNQNLKKIVVFIEKYSPQVIVFIFYSLIAYLALTFDIRVLAVGAIPWFVFFIATVIRKKLNFKRPFEEIGFESVVPHSKGCSCPSRHATSSSIITMAAFYINPILGFISAIFTVIVSISRVITGVHYIKDVILGVLIGFIFGYISFFIIL